MYTAVYIECSIKKKTKNDYHHTFEEFRSIYLNHQDTLEDIVKKLKASLDEKYHKACDNWLVLNEMFKDLNVVDIFGKEPAYANFSIVKNTEINQPIS